MFTRMALSTCLVLFSGSYSQTQACDLFGIFDAFSPETSDNYNACPRGYVPCFATCSPSFCVSRCESVPWYESSDLSPSAGGSKKVEDAPAPPPYEDKAPAPRGHKSDPPERSTGPRWTITDTKDGLMLIDQKQYKVYQLVDGKWKENKKLVLPPEKSGP